MTPYPGQSDKPWDVLYIPSIASSFSANHFHPTADEYLFEDIERVLDDGEQFYVIDAASHGDEAYALIEVLVPAAYILEAIEGSDSERIVVIGKDPDGKCLERCLTVGGTLLYAFDESRSSQKPLLSADIVESVSSRVGPSFRYTGDIDDGFLEELTMSYLAHDLSYTSLLPWLTRIAEATYQYPALDAKDSTSSIELFDAFCFGQCPKSRLSIAQKAYKMSKDEFRMGWAQHMRALQPGKEFVEGYYTRKPGSDIIGVRNLLSEVTAIWEEHARAAFAGGKLDGEVASGIDEFCGKAAETLDWMAIEYNEWLVFVLSVGYSLGLDYLMDAVLDADVPLEAALAGTPAER